MSFLPINNTSKIKDNIAYQYNNSINLQEYIAVLLSPFDELEEVFADILNARVYTSTSTEVLDTLGIIVDQPRVSYNTTEHPFFGLDAVDLDNPVKHEGLGDLDDASIGGIFRSVEQPLATIARLNNAEYRPLLVGKQHSNNFKGGTENLIRVIKEVFEITETGMIHVEEIFITANDPFVRVTFNTSLTSLQKSYLEVMNVLPKPGGIRYEYVYN